MCVENDRPGADRDIDLIVGIAVAVVGMAVAAVGGFLIAPPIGMLLLGGMLIAAGVLIIGSSGGF